MVLNKKCIVPVALKKQLSEVGNRHNLYSKNSELLSELHNQEDIVAEDADQTTLDLIPSNDNEVDVDHIGEAKDHSDALA